MAGLKLSLVFLIVLSAAPVHSTTAPVTPRPDQPIPIKIDEFGDIHCEDEYARLDNFAIQLQNTPSAVGYIVYYGGRRFRGRLPRVDEAAVRAGRMKPYLVNRRGVPADQVAVINGGYQENFGVELWIVPAGAKPPSLSTSTVPANQIKFRKGKATRRQFQCNI